MAEDFLISGSVVLELRCEIPERRASLVEIHPFACCIDFADRDHLIDLSIELARECWLDSILTKGPFQLFRKRCLESTIELSLARR